MNRVRLFLAASALVFLFVLHTKGLYAALGVGVGTGKIVVDEMLKSGEIYNLPPLSVINTGDEPSDYGVSVSYKNKEATLKPPEEWFVFEPEEFFLKPGESQLVSVKLNIPLKSIPGDYYCYLEGHPIKKGESGQTMIGIAAASKLSFSVAPSSVFEGVYYRVISLWKQYYPWTNIIGGTVLIFVTLRILSRFVSLNLSLKKQKKSKDVEPDEKQDE